MNEAYGKHNVVVPGKLTGHRLFLVNDEGKLTSLMRFNAPGRYPGEMFFRGSNAVWNAGVNTATCYFIDAVDYVTPEYAAWLSNSEPKVNADGFFESFEGQRYIYIEVISQCVGLLSLACDCGFYASTQPVNEYLETYDRYNPVEAIIQGWGKAVVGSKGFRCEKAEIVALVSNDHHNLSSEYDDIPRFNTLDEAKIAFPISESDVSEEKNEWGLGSWVLGSWISLNTSIATIQSGL